MAGASVLFLGTGDAFCNGGRLHTAFHVAADGYQALIDCGATTIAVMRHLQMDVAALDATWKAVCSRPPLQKASPVPRKRTEAPAMMGGGTRYDLAFGKTLEPG